MEEKSMQQVEVWRRKKGKRKRKRRNNVLPRGYLPGD